MTIWVWAFQIYSVGRLLNSVFLPGDQKILIGIYNGDLSEKYLEIYINNRNICLNSNTVQ